MIETRPPLSRPGDFSAFWSRTHEELEGIPPRLDRQPTGNVAGLQLERFAFDSLGEARIHGYLLRWEDGTPRPLVVHSHGYGGQTTPMWSWAGVGLNIVGIDVRGHGESRSALPSPSRWGWVRDARSAGSCVRRASRRPHGLAVARRGGDPDCASRNELRRRPRPHGPRPRRSGRPAGGRLSHVWLGRGATVSGPRRFRR